MKLKALSLTLATTALVALSLPVIAQDQKGPNESLTTEAKPNGDAELAALAYKLYEIGVADNDALTVLAAAKKAPSYHMGEGTAAKLDPATVDIETHAKRKAAGAAPAAPAPIMKEGDPRPVAVTTFGSAGNEDDGTEAPPTQAEMFAKAKELAGDDTAMLDLIADAEAEASRGRIGGSISYESRLPTGMYDVWEIPYYGNSYAEIAVVGDGDANLDLTITDENGNVICYDVSPSDQVYCDWVPAWDGYFYVTVENKGGKRNTYYLLTN